MFFLLSKILQPLLEPLNWFLAGGIFVICKSSGSLRRWLIGGWLALVVLTNPWLADRALRAWEIRDTAPVRAGEYDAILALGGGCVTLRESTGKRLQVGETFDRVFQALLLYQQGAAPKIILTGNKDPEWTSLPSESEASRSVLLSLGVPDSAVIAIPSARNTYEEAQTLAAMMQQQPGLFPRKKIILVTSASHLRRAMWCFARFGIQVTPQASNFRSGGETPATSLSRFNFMSPSADTLITWRQLLHEWVGFLVYLAKR